ncbi:MAG: cytochrome-c peroxidase, partial [Planctomycetes bacterium]|nr:cytochrome-c peroxidase [Planctomycetota bacterium]
MIPALGLIISTLQVQSAPNEAPWQWTDRELSIIQSISPSLPPYIPPNQASNRHADSESAARLGAMLFFDPRLSANGKVSCSTCHDPAYGWSDAKPKSLGVGGGTPRHSPSIINASYQRWHTW